MAATAKHMVTAVFLLLAASTAAATTLTLHNLCPYPVWPLVTPNTGFPAISDNTARLDGGGRGLVSLRFPPGFWAGRVVARTGCGGTRGRGTCETGDAPPMTVVQLAVHAEAPRGDDVAAYSVSLVDGFNVPAVVSPQAVGGGQCPALGCAADLNAACPRYARRVVGAGGKVVACGGERAAGYFKERCPLTRTTPTDVEPVPQRCIAPGELKVVFCQPAMVGEPELVIRTVVADN